MKIKHLIAYLEEIAPPVYQESYDNAGLIVGDPEMEIKGVLICLDSVEAVVEEAVAEGHNLIIAHHPIIFKGLKRITGQNYVERTIIRAIRNGIAIYAIHTNLDNVFHQGVNTRIAERIGLTGTRILAPKQELKKLQTFVQAGSVMNLYQPLLDAGAERIEEIESVLFPVANGQIKVEVTFPGGQQNRILSALRNHDPAAEKNIELHKLENTAATVGSGMIGDLPGPMPEENFLHMIKEVMGAACIRHTALTGRPVSRVALCGGAGGFLLGQAIRQGAQAFITADYKYHEFFDADGKILIADIGHFESEQFTIDLLYEIISQKFSNFAVRCTTVNTNPVRYL